MAPVNGILDRMIAGLRAIRRRLRAPTDSDLDDLEDLQSQEPNEEDEAQRRLDIVRARFSEVEDPDEPPEIS